MFTGIIQSVGVIRRIDREPPGARFVIEKGGLRGPLAPGDSVAVSGVCLTLVAEEAGALVFDTVAQTLAATTLGERREGDRVNLEASLRAGDSISGHFVQGHVDALAKVRSVEPAALDHRIVLELPAEALALCPPRGSVTVDGVSLTIAAVVGGVGGAVEVALIPETLARTTLVDLAPGDACNIETDVLTRAVAHYTRAISAPEDRGA